MELRNERFDTFPRDRVAQWNSLLVHSGSGINKLDMTSSFDWVNVLRTGQLDSHACWIASLEEEGRLTGVLPYYRATEWVRFVPARRVIAIAERYTGRNGLIAEDPAVFADRLMNFFCTRAAAWDQLVMTLMDDSPSMTALHGALAQHRLECETVACQDTPYIEFPANWDDYLASLPKKFRWLLRDSRKKMDAAGHLTYRPYTADDGREEFLRFVVEVERNSWKEQSGTSITANPHQQDFYTRFAAAAAVNGWLSGHVLLLDEKPIAYIFGIVFGNVFHDLKESYDLTYQPLSPGHVLKSFVFPELIARGIQLYDFRGLCDDYKMKWANRTYRRSTIAVYNDTLRASCITLAGRVRTAMRKRPRQGRRGDGQERRSC